MQETPANRALLARGSLSYVTVNSNVNSDLQCLTTVGRSVEAIGLFARMSNRSAQIGNVSHPIEITRVGAPSARMSAAYGGVGMAE